MSRVPLPHRIVLTEIYPDDFSYGIIYGYAKRFLPAKTAIKVYYDTDVKARDYGGDGPIIVHLTWE